MFVKCRPLSLLFQMFCHIQIICQLKKNRNVIVFIYFTLLPAWRRRRRRKKKTKNKKNKKKLHFSVISHIHAHKLKFLYNNK